MCTHKNIRMDVIIIHRDHDDFFVTFTIGIVTRFVMKWHAIIEMWRIPYSSHFWRFFSHLVGFMFYSPNHSVWMHICLHTPVDLLRYNFFLYSSRFVFYTIYVIFCFTHCSTQVLRNVRYNSLRHNTIARYLFFSQFNLTATRHNRKLKYQVFWWFSRKISAFFPLLIVCLMIDIVQPDHTGLFLSGNILIRYSRCGNNRNYDEYF